MAESFPPRQPGQRLYDSLFAGRDRSDVVRLISRGIEVLISNTNELLQDADLLCANERYSRASFLVTTAEEEISKIYILLDVCRLKFSVHEGALRNLCSAFYDHIKKHGYYYIVRMTHEGFRFWNVEHVREVLHLELVKWWPADEDWGVPIMPNSTYFKRESNLYVDFDHSAMDWSAPSPVHAKFWVVGTAPHDKSRLNEAKTESDLLKKTLGEGLFKPEALEILNEVFGAEYITEKTPTADLNKLYEKVEDKIRVNLSIAKEQVESSALEMWPMYHLLTTAPS